MIPQKKGVFEKAKEVAKGVAKAAAVAKATAKATAKAAARAVGKKFKNSTPQNSVELKKTLLEKLKDILTPPPSLTLDLKRILLEKIKDILTPTSSPPSPSVDLKRILLEKLKNILTQLPQKTDTELYKEFNKVLLPEYLNIIKTGIHNSEAQKFLGDFTNKFLKLQYGGYDMDKINKYIDKFRIQK